MGEGVEEEVGALVPGRRLQERHRLGRQLGGQLFKNHWLLHHLQTFSSLKLLRTTFSNRTQVRSFHFYDQTKKSVLIFVLKKPA